MKHNRNRDPLDNIDEMVFTKTTFLIFSAIVSLATLAIVAEYTGLTDLFIGLWK